MQPTFTHWHVQYRFFIATHSCRRHASQMPSSLVQVVFVAVSLSMHAANLPAIRRCRRCRCLRRRLFVDAINLPSLSSSTSLGAISSLSNAANLHCRALSSSSCSSLLRALVMVAMHLKCHRVQESSSHCHYQSLHLFFDAATFCHHGPHFVIFRHFRHGFGCRKMPPNSVSSCALIVAMHLIKVSPVLLGPAWHSQVHDFCHPAIVVVIVVVPTNGRRERGVGTTIGARLA